MAVALSEAFGRLRQGIVVDLKKALEAAHRVGRRDLPLGEVSLPNGTVFRNVQIDTDQDARQFDAMVDKANQSPPPALVSVVTAPRAKPKKKTCFPIRLRSISAT